MVPTCFVCNGWSGVSYGRVGDWGRREGGVLFRDLVKMAQMPKLLHGKYLMVNKGIYHQTKQLLIGVNFKFNNLSTLVLDC